MKPFKILNWQYLQKRRFLYNEPVYFPAIVFAMLLGMYLDLYFTGMGMYSFPSRPFADVFEIHIVFNLAGLPAFTWFFLWAGIRMNKAGRGLLIVLFSMAGTVLEVLSESLGMFWHAGEWKHWYTFIGYLIFLLIVWNVFKWTNIQEDRGK